MTLPSGFASKETLDLFAFAVPERIKLADYPKVIKDFRIHIINVKKQKTDITRVMTSRKAVLRRTDFKNLGSNDKEREAAFELHLSEDEMYKSMQGDLDIIEWRLEVLEAELKEVIESFGVLRLRHRSAVVSAELFGGIPVDPEEAV